MTTTKMNPLPAPVKWLVRTIGSNRMFGNGQSFVVLMFHRVLAQRDPMLPDEPDADDFLSRMTLLADAFNVLPLLEAHQRLRAGTLPPRAVCITFDDGYRNNLEVALPILFGRNLPATVFVAPGYSDGRAMFNDLIVESVRIAPSRLNLTDLGLGSYNLPDHSGRAAAANEIIAKLKYQSPEERSGRASAIAERVGLGSMPRMMMNDVELKALRSAGVDVGAHTVWHPILNRLGIDEARSEIVASKQKLEELLGEKVRSFAYPNGKPGQDFGPQHVDLVRQAGFEVAVSTAWGAATSATDPLLLPRIAPWDSTSLRYMARILSTYRSSRATET